jgi:glycogen debranching enzyme
MNVLAAPSADPIVQVPESFSVSTTVSLQEQRSRVIKSADTFGVFDHAGDILAAPGGVLGLYHLDTRHLSRFDVTLGGTPPLLLSAMLGSDNVLLTSDLANPPMLDRNGATLDRGAIHIRRSLLVADGACHGRLACRNHDCAPHRVRVELRFDADFVDQFEVRGMHRERRGENLRPVVAGDSVTLSYRGLDDVLRATRLSFEPAPETLTADAAVFDLDLAPRAGAVIFFDLDFAPAAAAMRRPRVAFRTAYRDAKRRLRAGIARAAVISSSHATFNETLQRGADDLRMLVTDKPTGPYPYAGIPWFSTVFGRDALITALLSLAVDPALARGVLAFLAQEQATDFDPAADAEPGKVLHELRNGEMSLLGEVPFRRYYGSVDATPLFVMLAGAYLDRTGDLPTLRFIWPQLALALAWMDRRADEDGFVRYERSTKKGLVNQGWKDSYDSVFHADGTLARGAIALCEVQGYVFAARLAGAAIARQLGLDAQASALETQAERLRQAFEARFWCEPLGTYALALDGDGQRCQVRASNAGHLLMTGIAGAERGRRVAAGLMGPDFFTGWGIRTLAATELRYNPLAYHNGTVWPHDNAMIALGMARIGLRAETARLFEGIYAAASMMDLRRMPELFCGFPRRPGQAPTAFPVACAPQAWAAATIPAFLQACVGLDIDHASRTVRFDKPLLPAFLDNVTLRNLSVDNARVSVVVSGTPGGASVSMIGRDGNAHVVTTT